VDKQEKIEILIWIKDPDPYFTIIIFSSSENWVNISMMISSGCFSP